MSEAPTTRHARSLAGFAVALTLCTVIVGQAAFASDPGPPWNDPDRFRALAERSEAWPLRSAPPPRGWPDRCEFGTGLPIRLGAASLRVPLFAYLNALHDWRDRRAVEQARSSWLRLPLGERCAIAADRISLPPLREAYLHMVTLATGQLDASCYQPGLPGDPNPSCDRPDSIAWWLTFVRGWPLDITLRVPDQGIPDGEPIDGLLRLILSDPGHRRDAFPGGGEAVRSADGRFGGVILPRPAEQADIREPLFVSCLLSMRAWRPPAPGGLRGWTRCEVRYRHGGVLDVAYRFYREVFEAPDIPALDLRVRRLVQAMLDADRPGVSQARP